MGFSLGKKKIKKICIYPFKNKESQAPQGKGLQALSITNLQILMHTGINKYQRLVYSSFCSLFNYSVLRTCSYDIDLALSSVSVERSSVWPCSCTCESLTG